MSCLKLLLTGSALSTVAALATPAMAQLVAPSPVVTAGNEVADETIVVTGSRIRSSARDSQVPVTAVSGIELTNSGGVSVGDELNNLPSLRSTYSTANSTRFIGTTGLNLLDLRGLGVSRTLVLQNGKRLVSAQEGQNTPDVATIPSELLDRVDIVTGGASAVYGSDAIAGVVNFVLKDHFDGLSGHFQTGISAHGDRPTYLGVVTAGTNFSEGRGNIAASAEFTRNDQLRIIDRDNVRSREVPIQVEFNAPGVRDDGVPDRLFFNDVRNNLLSKGGTFVPTINPANPLTYLSRTNPDGTVVRIARLYRFQPDGTIRQADYGAQDFRFGQTATGAFTNSGPSNAQGGDGESLRDYGLLQPQVTRYVFNALGHFEFSPAFVPYFEAKYARVDSLQESSPSFGQGGAARGNVAGAVFTANSSGIPIRFDNAFLTPQAATFLRSVTNPGDAYFRINRNNVDLGSRGEDGRRQTYRGVIGVRGEFNTDWTYDLSVNYGEVKNRIFSLNNRLQQRFELAVDAVRDPASGQIVCRSKLTPPAPLKTTTATGAPDTVAIAKNGQLANDVAQCVPLNILGNAASSQAARNYVNATTQYTGRQTQFDISGFVSGDLSQLFSLPGGPIAFAVGGEYRRETSFYSYGPVVSSGLTFLNAIPDFNPRALDIKEGFGELKLPLIKDLPLIKELSLQAAGRYSNYNNRTGGVIAWNGGGVYSPFSGLRFRANYAVAVRAPTPSDLYSSPTQNFANPSDPCDVQQIDSGTPTRRANCLAAGVPVNQPGGFVNLPARSQSTELRSSGNDQLREERSRSLTVGAVFTPKFLPDLSVSVDYYRIVVKNVITAVAAQDVLNLCYDAPTLNNEFCPNVFRDPATSFFLRPGVATKSFNYAKRIASGVDLDATYNLRLGNYGSLSNRVVLTWVRTRDNYPIITDQTFRQRLLTNLGDPEWAFNFSTDYKIENLIVGYRLRYLDSMYVNVIEDIISINGNPPQKPDYSSPNFYPATFYHDFRVSYDVDKRFQVYGGVDNAFDTAPPLGLTGTGEGSGIYDNVGRFMYVGVRIKI